MYSRKVRCFLAFLLALALASITSLALAAEKVPAGGKVAVVNGVVISQEQLDSAMLNVETRFRRSGRSPSTSELAQIREGVLDNLIARELLYQESQRKGIKADPKAVNEQLEAVEKKFPSEDQFKSWLKSVNLSKASLRSQLEQDQAIRELIERQFAEKTEVSDEEIKAYYDSHPNSFKKPEQVKASHILIKVEPQAEESQKAEARKKLEMIQGKLKKNEEFSALAKEYSEGPSSSNGGDLGYFRRGQMVKTFEDAAFALKPGEVSGIVETQFGYHLIKVTDKTAESTMPYAEVEDKLGQYLQQEKLRKEIGAYVESLRSNAKVEISLNKDSQ